MCIEQTSERDCTQKLSQKDERSADFPKMTKNWIIFLLSRLKGPSTLQVIRFYQIPFRTMVGS